MQWLRERTSNLDFGYKYCGGVRHANYNSETIKLLNRERKWLDRLRNKDFPDHFSGKRTYYFTGNSRGPSLVMVDIDCHSKGSLAGAMAFAAHIKEHFFPNLYFEPSTGGNGVHAYFILDDDRPSNQRALLLRLGKALDGYLICHPFDIEMVEIKGLAPVVKWGRDRRVKNYVAGTLAKLPRQMERFPEWQATTVLDLDGLMETIDQIEATIPKAEEVKKEIIIREKMVGSVSGKVLPIEAMPRYVQFAEKMMKDHILKTSGRHVVIAVDVAQYIMAVEFFSHHMNPDGSMPWARIKALWDKCCKDGDFIRAFDNHRFAAIRNFFSSLGVIDWQDNTYSLGMGGQKGQAAKWRFTEEFLEEIRGIRETCLTGTSSITPTPRVLNDHYLKPELVFSGETLIEHRKRMKELEQKVLELMRLAA